jgi:hypothetical protein
MKARRSTLETKGRFSFSVERNENMQSTGEMVGREKTKRSTQSRYGTDDQEIRKRRFKNSWKKL